MPRVQEVVAGEDIDLECTSSIPDTFTRWKRNSEFLSSSVLVEVNLAQSGSYECVVLDSSLSSIYTVIIELHVIGMQCDRNNKNTVGLKGSYLCVEICDLIELGMVETFHFIIYQCQLGLRSEIK